GKNSDIPNIDGIRLSVIEGCKEAGISAVRWPGGCCADHYHWKDGIGESRKNRMHPIPTTTDLWNHEFGTDEFMRLCELIGAEPILIANTATGTAQEFFDWFEYCNGSVNTKYGYLRSQNGHDAPYKIKYWGMGNTDENVWWIDYNDPVSYAKRYMQFMTSVRGYWKDFKVIGLGLSKRHKMDDWVAGYLDHVTRKQMAKGPDYLSIHHYIGSAKGAYKDCGGAIDFNESEYYASIRALSNYQSDIDIHRNTIQEHTNPKYETKICFDEWGLWHKEATNDNGTRQIQTLRDGIFAACAMHLFYRNCDIVEFAMQTQLANLLQSLFETEGKESYKTPTFYVFKIFKEHIGQYILNSIDKDKPDDNLDIIASINNEKDRIVITIVNTDYLKSKDLKILIDDSWVIEKADIIYSEDIHCFNSFSNPDNIKDTVFNIGRNNNFTMPSHSILRLVYTK
ncbi:MAG: alpha-L-arabinofuranosidase C-terminal domain-containing protein, partial [Methanomicrobium sp.]|nr:alpha-L-arabinofuranosidase C-terminal domain-containing protein [Methanomicrobium sp.]